MNSVLSLLLINIKQGIREKTFWGVAFFFLFLLAFSLFLGELSIGEKEVALRNISLSAIEVSCLFLVVLGMVNNFYREKETRLKEVYLSYFPQTSYLAGKLLGYLVICFTYIFMASVLSSIVLVFNRAFLWQYFWGCFGIFLKISLFCSLCLLFACIFEYSLLATIATVFAYVSAEFSMSALKIVTVSNNVVMKMAMRSLYHILPNTDKIDLKYQAIYGQNMNISFAGHISLYVLVYILLTFTLSVLVFVNKEH
jgi:ABC-type transport system involved in multi-copper enzyme maturation permease subunit